MGVFYGPSVVWGGPFVPRSSATRAADDVKEGGLGLGFSEPELAATLGSLSSPGPAADTPPWFLCSVEL